MGSLINRTVFIVGNKKNSGKTTFLNAALNKIRGKGRLAYLSIGVDGETKDQIFGWDKPRVFAKPGDYVVTLESALKYTDAKFKKLKTFSYKTVLGRPMLIRILKEGYIEIIGPENNTQLASILKCLRSRMKIKTILVDGAINRITQVASFPDAEFIYLLRVDRERVPQACDELRRMMLFTKIYCHSRESGNLPYLKVGDPRFCGDDNQYIKGPLTKHKAEALVAKKVILEDFTKVFLNYSELKRFLRTHKIYFVNKFKLKKIVVNLFGVPRDEFLKHLSDNNLSEKLEINEIEY